MKPTLVTGANGHLGNNVCRLLAERGEPVRAMIRTSADPGLLHGLDVEIVRGDILDPASTARAMAGCGRVYHVAAGFVMWARDPERDIVAPSVAGTRHVVEAAARAGVDEAALRQHHRHGRHLDDARSHARRGELQHDAAHLVREGQGRGRARGARDREADRPCR